MSYRVTLTVFIVFTIVVVLPGCPSTEASKPQVPPPLILVFADVTDSLRGDEPAAVHAAINDIFDRAPDRSTIIVYPVVPVMAYAEELIKYDIPFRTSTGVAALTEHADHRAARAKETVAKLTSAGKMLQPRVASSCLFGALMRAADHVANANGRPVEVVLISDMVEECDRSIGGRRVMLNHPGIAAEIVHAKSFPGPYPNLRGANIHFIYPAAANSGHDAQRWRADPEELKEFWRAVLARCNAGRTLFYAGTAMFREDWKSTRELAEQARK